jgi:hypothetical protein
MTAATRDIRGVAPAQPAGGLDTERWKDMFFPEAYGLNGR